MVKGCIVLYCAEIAAREYVAELASACHWNVPSSVLWRVARGEGVDRPEPVGENICLFGGSRDMLGKKAASDCGISLPDHAWSREGAARRTAWPQ